MGCGENGDMNKKKLRGAVIGYGFISASGHIPGYLERNQHSDDVQIVAVADICPVTEKPGADSTAPGKDSMATIETS